MEWVGRTFKVKETFKVLCCSYYLEVNDIVEVMEHYTPNRLMVVLRNGRWKSGGHKVKRSTLNRCSEEVRSTLNRCSEEVKESIK